MLTTGKLASKKWKLVPVLFDNELAIIGSKCVLTTCLSSLECIYRRKTVQTDTRANFLTLTLKCVPHMYNPWTSNLIGETLFCSLILKNGVFVLFSTFPVPSRLLTKRSPKSFISKLRANFLLKKCSQNTRFIAILDELKRCSAFAYLPCFFLLFGCRFQKGIRSLNQSGQLFVTQCDLSSFFWPFVNIDSNCISSCPYFETRSWIKVNNIVDGRRRACIVSVHSFFIAVAWEHRV